MRWMFLVLLSCLCQINPPSILSPLSSVVAAVRLRENSNVLVPNNDVNLKAKIKKAINGDVDVVDLEEVDVEEIKEKVKNPKIEKIIVDQLERGKNKDEVKEVSVMSAMNLNENFTTESLQSENVTQNFNFTTPFQSTIEKYNATVSVNYTMTSSTSGHVNSTLNSTSSYVPTEASTTPMFYNETTTTEGNWTSTTVNYSSSTFIPVIHEAKEINQCILNDREDIKPKWINYKGKLEVDAIKAEDGSVETSDFSWKFKSQNDFRDSMRNFMSTNKLMVSSYFSKRRDVGLVDGNIVLER